MFLFLGQGYVASHIRNAFQKEECWGTSRTADPSENIVFFDGVPTPEVRDLVARASHILISIPPDGEGLEGAQTLLGDPTLDLSALQWLGYLSSTSVYGDHQGAWVTEESATYPGKLMGKPRLMAERCWQKIGSERDLPLHIFRLSGIYGPGRSVFDRMQEIPSCVDKDGCVFSRIHVEDIVGFLRASTAAPAPGEIYNLADDEPASPCHVMAYACTLLGLPAPLRIPFEEANLSPLMRAFYVDNKRVDNAKIKRVFGRELLYPTYREGLAAIFEGGKDREIRHL